MKSLGALISTHKGKKFYQIIYLIPMVILLLMCYPIGKAIVNAPEQNRMMIYILLGMNIVLFLILLVAMNRSKPAYYFELFENGIRLVYKNEKKEPTEILFSEIVHCWQYRLPQNERTPNLLAFEYGNKEFIGINSKYVNVKSFIKHFLEKYNEIQLPIKQDSLQKGERIHFSLLPPTTPQTILAEVAYLPFIKNVTPTIISLDKFSLFAGDKAESISSISSAKVNPETGTLTIFSTSGAIVFEYGCDLISDADLLLRLINFLTESR
jgi:hypothetical protein